MFSMSLGINELFMIISKPQPEINVIKIIGLKLHKARLQYSKAKKYI